MTGLEFLRNPASRLRHDLDAPLKPMPEKPVAVIVLEGLAARGVLDAFDRLEDGAKRRTDEPFRQKTRSAEASIRVIQQSFELTLPTPPPVLRPSPSVPAPASGTARCSSSDCAQSAPACLRRPPGRRRRRLPAPCRQSSRPSSPLRDCAR